MTYLRWLSLVSLLPCAALGCAPDDPASEPQGASEDHLTSGQQAEQILSPDETADLIRQAGFPEDVVGKMMCTVKYESSFNARASHTNRNGSVDRGLFQINSANLGHAGCPSSASALWDPATNASCASAIYNSQGIGAWAAYTNHRPECDAYLAPGPTPAATTTTANANPSTPAATGDTGTAWNDPSSLSNGTNSLTDPWAGTNGGTDPWAGTSSGVSCWSSYFAIYVESGSCVQGASDWGQCFNGQWYSGATSIGGPAGACTSYRAR